MPAIYRKTDKGRAEIETRAHRLAPRLRAALIVVDGRRDDAELARLVMQSDEVLDLLEQQGFVERVAVAAAGSRAPLTAPAPLAAGTGATRPAPLDSPTAPLPLGATPGAPAPLAIGADFSTRKRGAARTLTDAVGPMSEPLALQIEKAKEERTLRPLLVLARDSIRNVRGSEAARAFEAKFLS